MRIEKKCDVCDSMMYVDKYGNGKCNVCKWEQSSFAIDYPDAINPPNFTSYNNAKRLWENKIKFKPSFEEILGLVDRGFDISFIYKKKRYQLDKHENFTFWEMGTNNYVEFDTVDEIVKTLKVDNHYLRDCWEKVHHIRYE